METKLLGDITLKIGSGATPSGGNNSYKTSGISLIRSQNVHDFKFSIDGLAFIDDDQAKKLENVSVQKDDVLINITGDSIARTCVVPDEIIPARVNQHVSIIRCKPEYNPKYVHYYLVHLKSHLFQICGVGGTRNALTKDALIKLPIKISNQQNQIAKVLSDLDAKIELNNKINDNLEAMAKTLYYYWFVQYDFPDSNGKPYKTSGGKMVCNTELNRNIPEGWSVKELKKISKNMMGQSPKGESYNKEGIGMPLLNGPADYNNGSLLGRTFTTEPTRICQKDDMVLCIRATIGNLTYAEKEFCLGRGVAAVRPNEKRYSEYIFYCLMQEIERFKIQATGSIIIGITKDDLTDSKCIIPPNDLLNQFHKIANPIFSKQRKNKIENLKLASLRDWLLPMLMNGQLKVE